MNTHVSGCGPDAAMGLITSIPTLCKGWILLRLRLGPPLHCHCPTDTFSGGLPLVILGPGSAYFILGRYSQP